MGLHATYLGANGWLLEFGGLRLLVDPWLRGDLVFPPGPWLFRGTLPSPRPLPERLDLLLLTQGLPDHCHPPTLASLPRDLAVLGSPTAAAKARELGFPDVTALAPGDRHEVGELLVSATAGAPVPQVENGYLLEHPQGRVYLEPHGFLPRDLETPPLDAVITPVLDLGLPLLGTFVRGREVLPRILEQLRPATVLASTTGGDARFAGVLPSLLRSGGSIAEAEALVAAAPTPPSRFIDPVPGKRYALTTG